MDKRMKRFWSYFLIWFVVIFGFLIWNYPTLNPIYLSGDIIACLILSLILTKCIIKSIDENKWETDMICDICKKDAKSLSRMWDGKWKCKECESKEGL